jgi:hypothetical protein
MVSWSIFWCEFGLKFLYLDDPELYLYNKPDMIALFFHFIALTTALHVSGPFVAHL